MAAPPYSNHGANLLVTAPGGDASVNEGIVTDDRSGAPGYSTGDYTTAFAGTSAAAPIVSGVVSLMLEANAGLGWRDVQNILAASSTHTGSAIGATAPGLDENDVWKFNDAAKWNGGGMHFSNDYGYGLLDAYNAVRMAEVWTLFGPAKTSANEVLASTSGALDLAIPDFSAVAQSRSFTFAVTDDVTIENLQFTISTDHTWYSDLYVTLTAPDGTVYTLDDKTNAQYATAPITWTYGVAALRGQSSLGTWTATFTDMEAGDTGRITGFAADFYGSAPAPGDVFHFTDEFLTMAALDGSRTLVTDGDGGTDWIDLAAVAGDQEISLVGGASSYVSSALWFGIADGTGIENVVTGDGNDSVIGNALANAIYGMRGNDQLDGGDGDDTIDGGVGDDLVFGTAGDDRLIGGAGSDALDYGRVAGGVTVSLAVATAQATGGAGSDMISGFEKLYGTAAGDVLTGDDGDNVLDGGAGDDRLDGGLGHDMLFGGSGKDVLLSNVDGDDLDGGNDVDTVSYAGAAAGVTVDLSIETQSGAGNDRLIGIESVTGSRFDDVLTGNAENNRIIGAAGNDQIDGGDGDDRLDGGGLNDVIRGGAGRDVILGGGGNDRFFVDRASDLVAGESYDGGAGDDVLYLNFNADADITQIKLVDVEGSRRPITARTCASPRHRSPPSSACRASRSRWPARPNCRWPA
jgi:Ca2+-binding RTX toxin-like protein